MHKISILCLLAGMLFPHLGYSQKMVLPKHSSPLSEKRIHPIVEHFSKNYHKRLEKIQTHRSENFNRLLVLLIDFPEDDNPLTTGTGKFMLEPGDYEIPLGKPPHDREFFEANLEALRYYYLAVSFGQFDLEYDVYPKSDEDAFQAYTMPQEMAFYNQLDGTYAEMIEGFEQYFYDAMSAADNDPNIDFSQYEHIMIIHAGSDWQHDVLGDTPKDLPSFFIQMGDGKEYVTSDGVIVDSASNVPETITQDIREIDGWLYGYGLINSVMAHEFGHSLGFVDLYNVNSFRPAVGYYDIMDSGGSGLFGYQTYSSEENEYKYFLVEGGAPTLPGAWTRLLVPQWKQTFEDRGYLKTSNDISLDEIVTILPSSLQPLPISNRPYFVKVPLTDKEYLLIENRQVDPDGDGGTSFVGALPDSIDYRVILHPSFIDEDNSNPNYEYDFFLPGWDDTQGKAIGGGLVIWHIDEDIIYNNDNFANNSVNTVHSKRGVRIIEADNIQDIGNYYSYSWQGTAYEPYFRFMPKLNQQGLFTGWDDYSYSLPDGTIQFDGHYHNYELSTTSNPALVSNSDFESFYKIYNISSYPTTLNQRRTMTFKIGSTFFEQTDKITEMDSLKTFSNITKSSFFDTDRPEMLVIAENEIKLFNHIYSEQTDEWLERSFNHIFSPTQDIVTFDFNENDSEEYFIVEDNQLTILTNEGTILEELVFSAAIIEPPLYFSEHNVLAIATSEHLLLNNTELSIPNAKCSFNGTNLLATTQENAYLIDLNQLSILQTYSLPNLSEGYYPVAYKDINQPELSAFFLQTNHGEIVRMNSSGIETIFQAEYYSSADASQLALHFNQEKQLAYLLFGIGKYVVKMDIFGNLLNGFPIQLEDGSVTPHAFPKIIQLNNQLIHFIPMGERYYFAFDDTGNKLPQYSYYWLHDSLPSYFYWDELSTRLYLIHGDDTSEKTQINASYISNPEGENPIVWNGFRHNTYSLLEGNIESSEPEMKLSAYAFPNPATGNYLKIKVKNAPEDIELKIFDVAGNRIFQKNYGKHPTVEQDLNWSIAHLSSGVYFGLVKSGSKEKTIKFAIEK